jgi:hypothetical protein
MAKKKGTTKKTEAKKQTKPAATKPKSQSAPKTASQTELLNRTLAMMEEENWITKKQGKDFMESLAAVADDLLGNFTAVNIAGLVKITPVLRPARTVTIREFGNPDAEPKQEKRSADVTVRARPLKKSKDALPTVQKAQSVLRRK